MKTSEKFINIIAGPNGSGKTSFAKSFLSRNKKNPIFLNPDLIATGLSPLNDEQASFQAGRVLLTEIKQRIASGESFGFESTLSGRTYARLLTEARKNGFHIHIYFIFLNSMELSFKRIQRRVTQGGHNIPRSAILRRQSRCFENFWDLYRPLADDGYLFNNSGISPQLMLSKNSFEILDPKKQDLVHTQFLKGKVNALKK